MMDKSSCDYEKILQSLQNKRTYDEQLGQTKVNASLDFLNKLKEFQQVDNQAINVFGVYKDLERENNELSQANRNIIRENESLEAFCKRLKENGINNITSTVHKLSMINNELDNYCNSQDNLSMVHDPENIRKQTTLIIEKINEKNNTLFQTKKDAITISGESSIPQFDKVFIFHESTEASNRKKHSNIIQNYYKLRDKLNSVE